MRHVERAAVIVAVIGLAACAPRDAPTDSGTECLPLYRLDDGGCRTGEDKEVDSGAVAVDAGNPVTDAGVARDAGRADAGFVDAGFATDSGLVVDAGVHDSGVVSDAGRADAGFVPSDSGVVVDAGFPDSGVDDGCAVFVDCYNDRADLYSGGFDAWPACDALDGALDAAEACAVDFPCVDTSCAICTSGTSWCDSLGSLQADCAAQSGASGNSSVPNGLSNRRGRFCN